MPILNNSRHESFAQLVASGKSASEAYRQSGATGKNADVQAAKLVVRGSIRERIAELKAAQSQKSELSRDQLREFLTEVILTPAGKVNEQSRLCQSYKVTSEFREIRMPDKLRAVEQLAKLCGWNEAERFDVGVSAEAERQSNELIAVIAKLRGRGRNNQGTG